MLMSNQQTKTVVFDFDHTLTRWDSSDRFFRWLLKRDIWRVVMVIVVSPLLLPLLLSARTRKYPIRYAIWVATLGLSHDALAILATTHVEELHQHEPQLLLQDALNQLNIHIELGHQVVIATGSLEHIAREYLNRSKIGHVPLVASTLKAFLGGMVSDQHCFSHRKIPMLMARGFPPPWLVTYTDHAVDLPVISESAQWYLVNPKSDSIARVRDHMQCEPTVLKWR
jgi:phosphatidylglycerophosphatase C